MMAESVAGRTRCSTAWSLDYGLGIGHGAVSWSTGWPRFKEVNCLTLQVVRKRRTGGSSRVLQARARVQAWYCVVYPHPCIDGRGEMLTNQHRVCDGAAGSIVLRSAGLARGGAEGALMPWIVKSVWTSSSERFHRLHHGTTPVS